MKINFKYIFLINLAFFPTFYTVTQPVFALDVSQNNAIQELAKKIQEKIGAEVDQIKKSLSFGAEEKIDKYEKFKANIERLVDQGELTIQNLDRIALVHFPDVYPNRLDTYFHIPLIQIYKQSKNGAPLPRSHKKLSKFISNLNRKIDASIKKLKNVKVLELKPLKDFHISLCTCMGNCNKHELKKLLSPFKSDVKFFVEGIEVLSKGKKVWVVLIVKSNYFDALIDVIKQSPQIKCTVGLAFRTHISLVKIILPQESSALDVAAKLNRELAKIEGDIHKEFEKEYYTNIKKFGIKEHDFEYLSDPVSPPRGLPAVLPIR